MQNIRNTHVFVVSTFIAALALVGAGCAKKQSSAPGGSAKPSVSGAPSAQPADVPVTVDVQGDGGTVTVKDEGATPSSETLKGLKVYENLEVGFRFTFPKEWEVKVKKGEDFKWGELTYSPFEVAFKHKSSGQFVNSYVFGFTTKEAEQTLLQWAMKHRESGDPFIPTPITINGLNAVRLDYEGEKTVSLTDKSFPGGNLLIEDDTKKRVVGPDVAQDHSFIESIGITDEEFEQYLLTGFQFTK